MMFPHYLRFRWRFFRVWIASVIALLAASLPLHAQVHVGGDLTAVRLVATKASVSEVLQALQAAFNVHHSALVSLDDIVTGNYQGPMDQVLSRVLTGFNYVIRTREGLIQVTIIGRPGDAPPAEIARPTLPANTNPAAQWRSSNARGAKQ